MTAIAVVTVLGAVALIGALLLRRKLFVVTVDGDSMAPTYRSGERLLARRGTRRLQTGHVVVFAWTPAGTGVLMKRIAALPGQPVPASVAGLVGARVPPGHVVVLGDGRISVDSRHWGCLPVERIIGVVIAGKRRHPGVTGSP